MISNHTALVAQQAKAIDRDRLQNQLEAERSGSYVAIEPESGEHFVADSFSSAVAAARAVHPDRVSFVIRIGHEAAIHLGRLTQ